MSLLEPAAFITVPDAVAKTGTYPDMTRRMQDAMDRVGAGTVEEFAQKIGMATLRDIRYFYKWHSGQHRASLANWENVLAHVLLAERGELEPTAQPPAVADLRAEVQELRARVDEALRLIESQPGQRRSGRARS